MARRIGELLTGKLSPLDEADIKQFVMRQLASSLGTGVVCRRLAQGVAEIEVASPALHQEAYLFGWELMRQTKRQTGYQIRQVKIRQA